MQKKIISDSCKHCNFFIWKDVTFTKDSVRGAPCSVSDKVTFTIDSRSIRDIAVKAMIVWHTEDLPDPSDVSAGLFIEAKQPFKRRYKTNDNDQVPKKKNVTISSDAGTPQQRYRGRVVTLNVDKNFGFVKSIDRLPQGYKEDKDIIFSVKDCESGGIALTEGDILEFTLSEKEKQKPRGFSVKLVRCSPRQCVIVVQYLHSIHSRLGGEKHDDCVRQLLTCNAVWQCIGKCSDLTSEGVLLVLEILIKLNDVASMKTHVTIIMKYLCYTGFLNPFTGAFSKYIKSRGIHITDETMDVIRRFASMVAKHVPDKVLAIVTIMKPLIGKSVPGMEELLFTTLKDFVHDSSDCVENMEWDELPMVPSISELLHGPIENDANLRQIVRKGAYQSVEDYVDIYFRLLRADCFASLCSGIRNYLAGKLDCRDMNVYHNIQLVGIQEAPTKSGIGLAVKFDTYRRVNWDISSCLMFGNLLCLSPTGSFQDPVWATVLDRNKDTLKKHSVITIELASDCNNMDDANAIIALSTGNTSMLMAESPTYYRAYEPVLSGLQQMDPESLPFQDILVDVQKPSPPEYLETFISKRVEEPSGLLTQIASIIGKKKKDEPDTVEGNLEAAATLDSSQRKAFDTALTNSIGIIQGPPGTGKTYIGLKILEYIFQNVTFLSGPVLVLTYKNRALDDFLKDLVDKYPGEVARVGGRSSETDLEKCNLSEIRKGSEFRKPQEMYNQSKTLGGEADHLTNRLRQVGINLDNDMYFDNNCLLERLSKDQICTFLKGYSWNQATLPFKTLDVKGKRFAQKTEMINTWIDKLVHENDLSQVYEYHKPVPEWIEDMRLLLHIVVKNWMPKIEEFKNACSGCVGAGQINLEVLAQHTKEVMEDMEDRDVDDEQQERMAAVEKSQRNVNITDIFSFGKRADIPRLFPNAGKITEQANIYNLINTINLWMLTNIQRIHLIQYILLERSMEAKVEFQHAIMDFENNCRARTEIENQHKASILKRMKVIGLTITGASINNEVLRQVKPAIILVEEAAEVLEPHLLAILGPWVKHLILIGDHKQLKPPVETFKLRREYNFDVSMMERLILNNLPFATLEKQNRMRIEFADLLLDIYPALQSNTSRISSNKAPTCMEKSMYFWDHSSPETKGRSVINEDEALRAIQLALFLIQQGYKPCQITIIAAYQGQVGLLRRKIRQAEKDYPSLFGKEILDASQTGLSDEEKKAFEKEHRVIIHTIDNYQGDENEIVIISLVRSNQEHNAGFLRQINRRCVAQSRAKCGMYFIGNRDTLAPTRHWAELLTRMSLKDCVGEVLTLQCPRHPQISKIKAVDASSITLGSFCRQSCVYPLPCGLHPCKEKCQPTHSHLRCKEKISFRHAKCGHPGVRKCHQRETEILCTQKVPHMFSCGHTTDKACHLPSTRLYCEVPCPRKFEKCGHPCEDKCGIPCQPDSCKTCKRIRDEKEKKRLQAEREVKEKIKAEVLKEIEALKNDKTLTFQRKELRSDIDPEYLEVEDKVTKYIQPSHRWFPQVTKVEKIYNPKLYIRWLQAKSRMNDPSHNSLKFHGTSSVAVEAIIKDGFLLPKGGGMFGSGIYFATDASKSAQEMYTKGSHMLLLCDVLLGKPLTVESAANDMNKSKLAQQNCDSLFAKRGTREKGGVLYDEFVVFDPAQALPKYVIHYKYTTISTQQDALTDTAFASGKMVKYELQPKRSVNLRDPKDLHFRIAESQILRLIGSGNYHGRNLTVKSVDYYVNPPLMRKFDLKLAAMRRKYPGQEEGDYILAFHGTPSEDNVQKIVKDNFSMELSCKFRPGLYGKGVYFSEFPNVSIGYGGQLLLCKVLPGKSYTQGTIDSPLQPGYDSHIHSPDEKGRGQELVIFDVDQILPCYVIHLAS